MLIGTPPGDGGSGNEDCQSIRSRFRARRTGKPVSVSLLGNVVDVLEALLERDITPDIVTDQTSAHDPMSYVPNDLSDDAAAEMMQAGRDLLARKIEADQAMEDMEKVFNEMATDSAGVEEMISAELSALKGCVPVAMA